MNLKRYEIERKLRRMTTAAPVRIGHLAIALGRTQTYGYYLITNGKRQHYFYYYLIEPPTKGHRAEIFDAYPDALANAVDYVVEHWRKAEVETPRCRECQKVFEPARQWQVYCSARCKNIYQCRQRRRKASAA